jgi:hypothetical protein
MDLADLAELATFSAFRSVIPAVMDMVTEGTSLSHGGSGIPAASDTTRDSDSVSTAVAVAVVDMEVVAADMEVVAVVMEEVVPEDTADKLKSAKMQTEAVTVEAADIIKANRSFHISTLHHRVFHACILPITSTVLLL